MVEFLNADFSGSELERSIPFDGLRMMSGERGEHFVLGIGQRLLALEGRRRDRRKADHERWLHSLSALLANVALGIFNRVDSGRFVAISLNRNDYSGHWISVTALRSQLEQLVELGLIEGQRGYRDIKDGEVRHARRTRIRATKSLRRLLVEAGVSRKEVGWSERRDIVILREPDVADLIEPDDVKASRSILTKVSSELSRAEILLPDDAWQRVNERYRSAGDAEADRLVSGEESTTLYRIFKGGWDRGGRLYGGWWINLPKAERLLLTLHGSPIVERDFARLHPTLLYARVGIELNFDIYSVPGIEGPFVRELGKRTFNRLINRSNARRPNLTPTPTDRAQLPPGVSFRAYVSALVERLAPIAQWFGTGEGLRLQREDSDLALGIVDRLLTKGIVSLPIHDSFIVAQQNEASLIEAMQSEFRARYGFTPAIR